MLEPPSDRLKKRGSSSLTSLTDGTCPLNRYSLNTKPTRKGQGEKNLYSHPVTLHSREWMLTMSKNRTLIQG